MDETKTPKPGEWWIQREGKPYLCIAANDRGDTVWQDWADTYYKYGDNCMWKHWHHEPLCTGFDWVEPPAVDPGEAWEFLPIDAVLEPDDEYESSDGKWIKTQAVGRHVSTQSVGTYRRKIKPAEVWPKWYTFDWHETFSFNPWCIKRLSQSEGIRFELCDGKQIQEDVTVASWIEVTEAEALARVTPVTCPVCNELHCVEGECPMDWVTLPADHILRRKIDWFCTYMQSSLWDTVCASAGKTAAQAGFKSARCRRKDLPVAVPATRWGLIGWTRTS